MKRIVLLLEERSMQEFLQGLLPRAIPGVGFLCVPHEGKQDLEKSIPRKLRAWQEPGARFVVVRDNDSANCRKTKERLLDLCRRAGGRPAVVRLACQELEAWYLGEPRALAQVFQRPALSSLTRKARFRDPDAVEQPSRELSVLVPEFQKITTARKMGRSLSVSCEDNLSTSYKVFLTAIREIARFDKRDAPT